MKRLRALSVGALVAGPFYLLLVDTVQSPELYAGAGAVLLAALVHEFAYAEGAGHAAYRLRWLSRGWRLLPTVPQQIVLVCREILAQTLHPRPARGRLRTSDFTSGGDDDGHHRGRRALAEWLGTLAPNTIVLGVDPESGILLAHELHHSPDSSEQLDPLALGDPATA